MLKRFLSLALVAALSVSLAVTGCTKKEEADKAGKQQTSNTENRKEMLGNMYKTGMPIVKEPVELEVMVSQPPQYGPHDQMILMQELEKKTNVKIKWREIPSTVFNEKVNLMFASADFPDIAWSKITDDQLLTYGNSGDIIKLNNLIQDYAPNWVEILKTHPSAKKVLTAPDGNIYSLGMIRDEEYNSGLRDMWFINKEWLDKLGLKMPTNVNEFREVLKAFKEKDPNGNGKADEIPWEFLFGQYINGYFDICGSFGMIDSVEHIGVKNGKVYYTAMQNENKEAIKYLNSLYKDGTIDKEAFTQDVSQFRAKTKAEPAIIGSFSAYSGAAEVSLDKLEKGVYVAMPPLKGPNGEKPVFRTQPNTVSRGMFTLFKNNKYPEISMRWANELADKDFSIQAMYGPFGTHIEKTSDGKYKLIDRAEADGGKFAPGNMLSIVIPKETSDKMIYDSVNERRNNAYKNIYKPYSVSPDAMYPNVCFTKQQLSEKAKYESDIREYVKKTQAKWVVEGGIDQEWDEYLKKLKSLKVEEVLKIYQEALDIYNKN